MIAELFAKIADKLSPENLITGGLLLLTALVSALWAYWRTVEKKSFMEFFEFALPKEVILHPSAKADFLFWITKRLVMPFLLIPAGVIFVAGGAWLVNQSLGALF